MQGSLGKSSNRTPIWALVAKCACRRDPLGTIRTFIFFALFYLYIWLVVEPRFLYAGGGVITNFPVFFKGWEFFRHFLSYPGGLVEYLSAFLSQFFYYSWTGALVVTLQAWLLCLCTGYFFKAINTPRLRWVRFVPPILLLAVYAQYAYHFVTIAALLVALICVSLYIKLSSKTESPTSPSLAKGPAGKLFDLALFLVLSVILYALVAGAYFFFAALSVIYELLFKRRWQMALLYLLLAGAVPYVQGVLFFGASIIDAYTDSLPLSWKILSWATRREMVEIVYALYLLLPLTASGLGLLRIFGQKSPLLKKHNKGRASRDLKKRLPGKPPNLVAAILSTYTASPILRCLIESVALFAIAGAVAFFFHNDEQKTLSAIHHYACRRMWPQVLHTARRNPNSNFVVNAVNRALYHTGRLAYDMFSYPQHPDALLLTAEDRVLAYWHKFDTQIDLGLMNMAEKNLVECMEVYGEHPTILKRLALINMVKANYGSAKVYLAALSKTLFHTGWAKNYQARLQSDPNLSNDAYIQHLRSVCLKNDHGSLFYAKQNALSTLLQNNSKNRMAFEYLMAWFMLTKQLDKFTENIKRFDDLGYSEIPRLYEEAILIYVYGTKKPVYLGDRQPTPEARRQIEDFSQTFNRYRRNKPAAFSELADVYGDSYFFYHLYGFSGVKQ